MTNRRIEIDVVLNTEQVDQGFQEINEGGKKVGETFTGVGETFTGVGSAITKLGDNATQKLGAVGESASGAISAVVGLGQAAQAGASSFSGLIGPIGLVAVAIFEVVQAWQEYKDELEGVNARNDAYIASVSELTSALEELASNQVNLNRSEVENLQNLSMVAKLNIEEAQGIRERNAELDKRIFRLDKQIELDKEAIKNAKEQMKSDKALSNNAQAYAYALMNLNKLEKGLQKNLQARTKLQDKLRKKEQEAIEKGLQGSKDFAKFEEYKEKLLERSPKLVQARVQAEAKLEEDSLLNRLKLVEQNEETLKQIAIISANRRIREIGAMETLDIQARSQAIIAETQRLQLELTKIEQNEELKREQERQKRRARYAVYQAKRLAQERKLEGELRQIQSLQIQFAETLGADRREILDRQYRLELEAAKDNDNLKLMAELRYQNALTQLELDEQSKRDQALQQAEKARFDRERQQAQQRANFIFSSLEFDAQQIEDQTAREIALLELRYKKEISLNEYTQDQITELQRRESIERQKILDSSFDSSIDKLKTMSQDLLKESTGAIYQSLVDAGQFDLTFEELKYDFEQKVNQTRQEMIKAQNANDVALYQQKEQEITSLTSQYEAERNKIRAQESQAIPLMFGNILKGLGQQASAEAVMELARGFSKLGSPLTAGFAPAHFKASAIFAGVAASAGVGGAILTNNANTAISRAGRGANGNNLNDSSPTGLTQTNTTPQREQAESREIVYNINFGGAVIYDTQTAAEQAFADRLTNLQNRTRRGAPRRRGA